MKTEAIVVSAGLGKRLRAKVRKPYLDLLGKPILIRTLSVLSGSNDIDKIIVVVNRLDKARCGELISRYRVKKIKCVVAGGRHRFDSVYNGILALDKDTDVVLVHDGVRPFIDDAIIRNSVMCAKKYGACVVGVPVKNTVKKVASQGTGYRVQGTGNKCWHVVEKTVDRRDLWEIQTPQVFKKGIIVKAFEKFGGLSVTDDSMLVERLGVRVRVVVGSYRNIKITTPEDIGIARGIIECG